MSLLDGRPDDTTEGLKVASRNEYTELRLVNGETLRGFWTLWRDSNGLPAAFVDQFYPHALTPAAVVIQAIPVPEQQP
jgi:hypothetical protein